MTDVDSIDLEHPEASGIGAPLRETNITIRALCLANLLASQKVGILPEHYPPASDAAVMLGRMSLDSAIRHVRTVLLTLQAIAEQEGE